MFNEIVMTDFILVFLFLAGGVYLILLGVFNLPNKGKSKGLKYLTRHSLTDTFVKPFLPLVAKFIKIKKDKRIQLKNSLSELDLPYSPEEYYARAVIIAIYSLLTIPLVIFAGIGYLLSVCFVFAVAVFINEIDLIDKRNRKKRERVKLAMPAFIRSIYFKINSEMKEDSVQVDLVQVFEDYLTVASPAFKYDVAVLVNDLTITGDVEGSLRHFDARMMNNDVHYFVNILIGIKRGEDQREALAFLAHDMDVKAIEYGRLELEKIKRRVTLAIVPLAILTVVEVVYVLVYQLMQASSVFF